MRKIPAILINLLIVGTAVWLQITPNESVKRVINDFDNFMYDTYTRINLAQEKNKAPIVIVDIDEKSLAEQGAWPWPKARFAQLVTELRKHGAAVIAFTIVFSEESDNTATEYLKKIENNPRTQPELISILRKFIFLHEGNDLLMEALKGNDVVLGFIFNQSYQKGLLPIPEVVVHSNTELNRLLIPAFKGYLANLSSLQSSGEYGGFVTGIVDTDGIVRRFPLLMTYENGIYVSLALKTVQVYLRAPGIQIELNPIGNKEAVSKIVIGDRTIFTDGAGVMSIPYLGRSHYFNYISATDLLEQRVDPKIVANKIVFVGTSVPGISDLRPTPVQSLFPSVEIQANIAAAILANFSPHTPNWSKGAEIAFTLLMGLLLAFLLPFLRATSIAITLFSFIGLLVYVYLWLWNNEGLIFSYSIPLLSLIVLVIANLIYGYLFESKSRDILLKNFSSYVPLQHIQQLSQRKGPIEFRGESKVVPLLFADIRHFTDIAEQLTVSEVKDFLNRFYKPISEIIDNHNGVVDKYYGDMILAFWEHSKSEHPEREVLLAALEMQAKASELKKEFAEMNLPSARIGIGINTGEVYLGDMGSDVRRSYTVIGDAANLASRMEALTKFYNVRIIVGESVYEETKEEFIYRHLDRIIVKGKHVPVDIYQLISEKSAVTKELIKELNHYEKALDLYYNQKWQAAHKRFTKLVEKYPNIKVYSIFLKRLDEYVKRPPDDQWTGIFVRKKK